MKNLTNVTGKTRAKKDGKFIYCPHCYTPKKVYHFAWAGIRCSNPDCNQFNDKNEWLIHKNEVTTEITNKDSKLKNNYMKKVDLENPKNGDLKVWWIPQIPMKSFEYPVNSVQEGFILLDALAKYDLFQYENNVKPDYCNAGGLSVYEVEIDDLDEDYDGWCDWYSEMGEDIDYYLREENGLELLINDLIVK